MTIKKILLIRTIIIVLLLFTCTFNGNAQKHSQPKLEHIDNDKMQKQIDSSMKELDSMNARINEGYKNTMHSMDSINNHLQQEQNERNLNSFMEMQRENDAKAKKAMWLRLGLGVFFLGVLVFGLMRKRKKTQPVERHFDAGEIS